MTRWDAVMTGSEPSRGKVVTLVSELADRTPQAGDTMRVTYGGKVGRATVESASPGQFTAHFERNDRIWTSLGRWTLRPSTDDEAEMGGRKHEMPTQHWTFSGPASAPGT